MTERPYDTRRISASYGIADYRHESSRPDSAYRELFPAIAAAYEAAEAENAKGRSLLAEYNEALKKLRAYQQGLRDDEYTDPATEAKLTAALRKAEREMNKQNPVSRNALIAYDKLVLEEESKGSIVEFARQRAAAAQGRVLALSAELLAALKDRERSWTLARQPFDHPVEPGTVLKRVVETGNDISALEVLLKRLSAFPDLTGPAQPAKTFAERRAEIERQNTLAANATKARSRREGF